MIMFLFNFLRFETFYSLYLDMFTNYNIHSDLQVKTPLWSYSSRMQSDENVSTFVFSRFFLVINHHRFFLQCFHFFVSFSNNSLSFVR
jgi:hypothetical protein